MFENDDEPNCRRDRSGGSLRPDCRHCFGLCCVALSFAASADFAIEKKSGKPCPNLQTDFRCSIHKDLRHKGFKGCTAFDCFGAGQQVSQITFKGIDWHDNQKTAGRLFDVFPVMLQLHEMLRYLTEALALKTSLPLHGELRLALDETQQLAQLNPDSLLKLDVPAHRSKINTLLLETSERVWAKSCRQLKNKRINRRGADLIGAQLRGADLKGADLRGACLIAADLRGADLRAADFIGADLRDADLSGADLSGSIFLTQAQINSAEGDVHTELPHRLARPQHWSVLGK